MRTEWYTRQQHRWYTEVAQSSINGIVHSGYSQQYQRPTESQCVTHKHNLTSPYDKTQKPNRGNHPPGPKPNPTLQRCYLPPVGWFPQMVVWFDVRGLSPPRVVCVITPTSIDVHIQVFPQVGSVLSTGWCFGLFGMMVVLLIFVIGGLVWRKAGQGHFFCVCSPRAYSPICYMTIGL